MVLKTREKLIEVARQLFAHKGVANTTMNDIAEASDKGRRTIYTYFKNKKEIYNAVLESESDKIVNSLREIVGGPEPVEERTRLFLMSRLDHGRRIGSAYESMKSWLRFDIRRVDRIRQLVEEKEQKLFSRLLKEGVASGAFDRERCNMVWGFIKPCVKGLDLSTIEGADSHDAKELTDAHRIFVEFIISDITKK